MVAAAVVLGAGIGLWPAKRVEMTGMPGLIAILHSFVGLAGVLVGWSGYLSVEADAGEQTEVAANLLGIHSTEVVMGVFIGAVTSNGSIVAFLNLSARIRSNPLMLPGRNALNLCVLDAFVVLTVFLVVEPSLVLLTLWRRWRWRWAGTWSHRSAVRTCRSSSRCSTATPLGRCRLGLPVWKRPAHHHRRPGRLLRRLPLLHPVPGNEPVVPLRDRRRVRQRGRRRDRPGLRRAHRDQRRGNRRTPR
jgi:hypothetical protein